ncbi:uracil-DNA glycosylase [Verrucomicrobiaceae bacterium N1E253]|uniref:Type-4 uracil-DNA glycosylase n=1 Tax=Oceaniferula marina TaxID=2748318 RepID=A0A851GEG2_9BACT|nr:uracil-DNA glycosylase [Oceaniferula marina]
MIQYLRQLETSGQTHVHVDDEARQLLRAFYRRAQGGQASVASQAAAVPTVVGAGGSDASTTRAPSELAAPVASSAALPEIQGDSPEQCLSGLKAQAQDWAPAKALGGFRQTMVFSSGNLGADLMLVGEAPGFDEERLGEPFVGMAGQKLDAILRAMGTDRQQVYLSNILKFRPQMPNQTVNNRKPTAKELEVWLPFLQAEVELVRPKVIIALGVTTARALLGLDQSVEDMRGEFHTYRGTPLRVTFHPSYILNDEATPEKRMLWEDMLAVMERLGMPISEKQRAYFKR